jgi:hypothetical protein
LKIHKIKDKKATSTKVQLKEQNNYVYKKIKKGISLNTAKKGA